MTQVGPGGETSAAGSSLGPPQRLVRSARMSIPMRDYVRVLRRRLPVILVVAALVGGAILAQSIRSEKVWRSTASMEVKPILVNTFDQALDPLKQVNLATEIEKVTSSDVAARVADSLGISGEEALELAKRVTVTNPPDTLVLEITCRDAAKTRAQDCADTFTEQYREERETDAKTALDAERTRLAGEIAEKTDQLGDLIVRITEATGADKQVLIGQRNLLESQIRELQNQSTKLALVQTDPGSIIARAKAPKATDRGAFSTLVVAALVGLALGVVAAFVLENVDDRILDAYDVERFAPVEVLGVVHDGASFREARSVVVARAPEAHRLLVCAATDATVLDVTADLAVAFAGLDKHVLLVAGESANPQSVEALGVPSAPGLAELAAGTVSPFAATHPAPTMARVSVLPAGAAGVSVGELLATGKGRQAMNYVASGFDITLMSAGSVRATGSVDLASACDGVLVVATLRSTRVRDLEAAWEKLEKLNAPILGVLVRRRVGGIQRPRPTWINDSMARRVRRVATETA